MEDKAFNSARKVGKGFLAETYDPYKMKNFTGEGKGW